MSLNRIIRMSCLALAIILNMPNAFAQSNKHVILISLDGARPEFYMDSSVWDAPNLRKLKNEGAYSSSGMKSIFPSLTWPAHISMISGAYPNKHGIYYNKPFGATPGHGYWYYSYIKTRTLIDEIKDAGMTSGAVWWPVLLGSPIDYNFPIRRPEKDEVGDQLSLTIPYVKPYSLLQDIEHDIGRKFSLFDLGFVEEAQSKFVTTVSSYIIKRYKPNFLALHLGDIDHAEHAHGIDAAQTKRAVQFVDSLVGVISQVVDDAGIKDSTVIIVAGDHGHVNIKSIFKPNVYLYKNGLITDQCWHAKFYSADGSAFLFLNPSEDQQTLERVKVILKNTPEYKKGYFQILNKNEVKKKGGDPNASLALVLKEGIQAKNDFKGEPYKVLSPPFYSTHGYDPNIASMNTIFIAAGNNINHIDVQDMELVDLAPLIAELLGLNFDSPNGRLVPGIISEN